MTERMSGRGFTTDLLVRWRRTGGHRSESGIKLEVSEWTSVDQVPRITTVLLQI